MNARLCFAIATVFALGGRAFAAEGDLPQRKAGEAPDRGAALFPADIGDVLPGKELPTFELMPPDPATNVETARAAFERAQRKEVRWDKLFKSGVVAKVEAEACVLATARARARLEKARVAEQQRALDELRQRAAGGQLNADTIKSAESALQTAQTMSTEADAALHRTELLLAEANVDRQRRLLAMGAGSKSVLQRAESTLAQLQHAGN
jgi:multidrug resistance efflux pump